MIRGKAFLELRMAAGFQSWVALAAFLGVTKRTVENWERSGVPVMPEKLLRLLAADLSFLGDEWRGWRITAGQFVEFEGAGYAVSPGEMRAFAHMDNCIELQRRAIKALEAELETSRAQLRFQQFLDVSTKVELPDRQ